MMPLPSTFYHYMERREAKVSSDFHVRFDNAYYSVPRQYVHKRVLIKATATLIQISALSGDLLCEWPRAKYKGQWLTNPEHLPGNSREMAEWEWPILYTESDDDWPQYRGGDKTHPLQQEI